MCIRDRFYNIPAYLSGVKGSFTGLVDSIQQTSGYQNTLVSLMEKYNVVTSSGLNASNAASKLADASGDTLSNYIIDILYKLPSKGWDALMDGKDVYKRHVIHCLLKNLRIRQKMHLCTVKRLVTLSNNLYCIVGFAAIVALSVNISVLIELNCQPSGKSIYYRCTNPVQPA